MQKIDGRKLSKQILSDLKDRISRENLSPGLAIILVGDDPASKLYVRIKERACRDVGIRFEKKIFPADAGEKDIIKAVSEINQRPDINGLVVQLPLPGNLSESRIIEAVDPEKDADGFHPLNVARMSAGQPAVVPALVSSIRALIQSTGVEISGRRGLVAANSEEFFKPLAYAMKQAGADLRYSRPDQAKRLSREADILVVAAGRAGMFTAKDIKPDAIVVDVGINHINGRVEGDVDIKSLDGLTGYITPVPGGVGPVTVAMLLSNVVKSASGK